MAFGFGGSFHGTTGAALLVILCLAALGHIEASDTMLRREVESNSHIAAEVSPHGHLISEDDAPAIDASPAVVRDLLASQAGGGGAAAAAQNPGGDAFGGGAAGTVSDASTTGHHHGGATTTTMTTTASYTALDPATVNGFRFHLRSCETNLCMFVDAQDSFSFGDCDVRVPGEQFIAESVPEVSNFHPQNASAVILPTGKRMCALADSLLMQAGEEDCEFPNVTLATVLTADFNITGITESATEYLFHLRWKWPSQNRYTLNNITSSPRENDLCLLPPEIQAGEQRLKLTAACTLDPVVLWTNVTDYGDDKQLDPCRHAINDPIIDNANNATGSR